MSRDVLKTLYSCGLRDVHSWRKLTGCGESPVFMLVFAISKEEAGRQNSIALAEAECLCGFQRLFRNSRMKQRVRPEFSNARSRLRDEPLLLERLAMEGATEILGRSDIPWHSEGRPLP